MNHFLTSLQFHCSTSFAELLLLPKKSLCGRGKFRHNFYNFVRINACWYYEHLVSKGRTAQLHCYHKLISIK